MRNHSAIRSGARDDLPKAGRKVQTTLRLPRQLYERAKLFVEKGSTASVNDFIVKALAAYVKAMERKAIDEAFRPMATDKRYHSEALRIAKQFSASDSETIETGERDLVGV